MSLCNDKEAKEDSLVKVVVRCRPMSQKELDAGHNSIVELSASGKVLVHNPKEFEASSERKDDRSMYLHEYQFDTVFGPEAQQQEIYDCVCRPLVGSVLRGYDGTIFVYGQTGTGKTYTMEGNVSYESRSKQKPELLTAKQESRSGQSSSTSVQTNRESLGIMPRAFSQIFDYVESERDVQFLIRASYLEIYQEELRDLLRRDGPVGPELHEAPNEGVFVKNLTAFVCKSRAEVERLMRIGNQNRMIGATDMNERSSRSHAIFMITIEQQTLLPVHKISIAERGNKDGSKEVDRHLIRVGKLNLVDLAGSERQRKTNSYGQRQKESIKINLSLSALGNVINSLMSESFKKPQINKSSKSTSKLKANNNSVTNFIPYRDSKLTRLLQDSLGGNSKTLMIANIGPASYNYDETINTLSYASRAKYIRNRPKLNEDPKDTLLRQLQKEINELKAKLVELGIEEDNSAGAKANSNNTDRKKVKDELDLLRQKLTSLEGKLLNGHRSAREALGQTKQVLNEPSDMLKSYTREQELLLEKSRGELVDQLDREQAIRDELGRHEEVESRVKISYGSRQQEILDKKRLIKQVLLKAKSVHEDIETNQQAYRLELDELDQLQYNLQKELKLKCLIMDNFIPNLYVDQVLPRIVYDEKTTLCSIRPIDLALYSCIRENTNDSSSEGLEPRISTEFERLGATIYPNSLRFKGENLIESRLEVPRLDPPPRLADWSVEQSDLDQEDSKALLVKDYPSSTIQRLLDEALSTREPNIVI